MIYMKVNIIQKKEKTMSETKTTKQAVKQAVKQVETRISEREEKSVNPIQA